MIGLSYWNTLRMARRNFHAGENEGEFIRHKNHWWNRGIELTAILLTRCNLHCSYCPLFYGKEQLWDGKYPEYKESTLEEWKKFFENFPIWISQVYLSGGEPTLLPWIGDLINWLVKRGHHVILFSNLKNPEYLYNVKKSFRFCYYPTFHAHNIKKEDYNFKNAFGDDYDRFKSALEKLRANTDFRIIIKELEEDKKFGKIKGILSYAKKLYSNEWFFNENALLHAPPDAPITGITYWGCVKAYLGGK